MCTRSQSTIRFFVKKKPITRWVPEVIWTCSGQLCVRSHQFRTEPDGTNVIPFLHDNTRNTYVDLRRSGPEFTHRTTDTDYRGSGQLEPRYLAMFFFFPGDRRGIEAVRPRAWPGPRVAPSDVRGDAANSHRTTRGRNRFSASGVTYGLRPPAVYLVAHSVPLFSSVRHEIRTHTRLCSEISTRLFSIKSSPGRLSDGIGSCTPHGPLVRDPSLS
jgi:hypothetical protein